MSKIFSKNRKEKRAKWSRNVLHHSLLLNSKYNSSIGSEKRTGLIHLWLHTLRIYTHYYGKPYEK